MRAVYIKTWLGNKRRHLPGPLGDFYRSLLAKGMKPAMARLTLARKMAAMLAKCQRAGESSQ
jgi:hypothetical protein